MILAEDASLVLPMLRQAHERENDPASGMPAAAVRPMSEDERMLSAVMERGVPVGG